MSRALSEAQEDYLEAIYEIIDVKGGVRVKDIAERLDVKNSSVTVALRHLRSSGFVNYEPYGIITLTSEGEDEARRLSETHGIFKRFFVKMLGADQKAADETACRLEHAMAPEVMGKFLQFIKFLSSGDESCKDWQGAFDQFCRSNVVSEGNLASPADFMNDTQTAGSPL